MTIRMHRSTDRGAPALTGQQGKMCAMLLETLCKGVPAVGPGGIGQTGGLATCEMIGHGFITGQTVTIFGATQPEYNGNHVITVEDEAYFTFPIAAGAPASATGTITVGGQKTIGTPTSITRSGTTVTVALTAHGMVVGNRVFIQGAIQAEYNGWQTVATQADANTFTFELAASQTPATPATGTILVRYGEAGLGWSLPFTGTNRNIFKQGVSGTRNQYVLAVDETNASYHNYGVGMHMAEGATALSTLTNLLYGSEGTGYGGMVKSGTADSTARRWVVVGDHRTIIIAVKPVVTSTTNTDGWHFSYFGDIVSYLPNDNYPVLSGQSCRHASYNFNSAYQALNLNTSSSGGNCYYMDYAYASGTSDNFQCYRMSRNHLGAVGSINVSPACVGSCLSVGGNAARTSYAMGHRNTSYSYDIYPDPVHGGMNLEKLHVVHLTAADNTGNPVTRGEFRGLWNPGHRRSQLSTWVNNDTFLGTGELAGKTFEIFDNVASTTSWFIIETSDTWSV